MVSNPTILHIETAANSCSVALSWGSKLLAEAVSKTKHAHESRILLLIEQCLMASKLHRKDLQGIAVSIGPGSYTGLRIGLSTAKGLCYALNLPLIEVGTLSIIAAEPIERFGANFNAYIPMIDARRNEVYTSVLAPSSNVIQADHTFLIAQDSIADLESQFGNICFCGTGSFKIPEFAKLNTSQIYNNAPLAASMIPFAIKKWQAQSFINIFSASPTYLKSPNITMAKPRINR